MTIIKYRRGQERDIVRETSNFKDSIFYNQYSRALEILNGFIEDFEDETLKVMAFCGDRGDGKTSCMMSVLEIIEKIQNPQLKRNEPDVYDFIEDLHCLDLNRFNYDITPLIDPSFFDNAHNVLEIVIGQMYSSYSAFEDGDSNRRTALDESFQKVKRCLQTMSNASDTSKSLNGIDNLNTLADAIELKNNMASLVDCYLKYMGRDILLISVDDIDLSLNHAYNMCEQIRKYLAIPKCIVLMCVKMPQLQQLVSHHFRMEMDGYLTDGSLRSSEIANENPVMDEADIMAKKYLDKFITVTSRIDMPKAYSLSNIKIEIIGDRKDMPVNANLDHFVLEMIFRRTRYLFYNPIGGVSPIIPNNLRELFNLVGLLVSMRTADDNDSMRQNKNLFKSYFFTVWKERFDLDTRSTLDTLLNFDFGTSFNKEIVKVLINHFKDRLDKDYENEADDNIDETADETADETVDDSKKNRKKPASILYDSIVSKTTFGYNVTAGDVFYLFSRLEKETLSESGYALLFFLKSFYSIKLYETYEFITENENEIYPDISSENIGLTVIDHRFDHTNKLQQLIGGSYFTYVPGDLIAKDGDLHIIESEPLHNLIKHVKDNFDNVLSIHEKPDSERTDAEIILIDNFDINLQMMEYFILSIKCAIRMKRRSDRKKSVVQFIEEMKKNVDAFQFREFSNNTGYYLYDVMAPFSAIVNPRFAYLRFDAIDDALFEKILKYPESLIAKMINKCSSSRTHISYEDKKRQNIHRLLSVAAIRNAEVLTAIKDNILIKRYSDNKNWTDKLKSFYKDIQKCEMRTHRFSDTDGSYLINFLFLEPISFLISHLLSLPKENEKRKRFLNIFKQIDPTKTDADIKADLKKAARSRRSYSGIAKDIIMLTRFNDLDEKKLTEFVKETLPEIKSANIDRWIDNHFNNLRNELNERTSSEASSGSLPDSSVSPESEPTVTSSETTASV